MNTIKFDNDSEYLEQITGIALDQDFGTTLNSRMATINKNFQKLVSIPFLQGDHGRSVEQETVRYTDSDHSAWDKCKKAIYSQIYGSDTPSDQLFGGIVDGVNSWNSFEGAHPDFIFYRLRSDDGTKFTYVCQQMIAFTDSRVRRLNTISTEELIEGSRSFTDLSCCLTLTASVVSVDGSPYWNDDASTVTAVKYSIFPTLYFSEDSKCWCWRSNGANTGIIAQGIKGDPGQDVNAYICRGTYPADASNEESLIKITSILEPDEYSSTETMSIQDVISEGSLVGVWFDVTEDNQARTNFVIGLAQYAGSNDSIEYVYVRRNQSSSSTPQTFLDFRQIINTLTLKDMLDTIDSANGYVKGLYVPSKDSSNSNSDMVHMLWNDSQKNANLGKTAKDNREHDHDNNLPQYDSSDKVKNEVDGSTINLWYHNVKNNYITASRSMTIPADEITLSTYSVSGNPGISVSKTESELRQVDNAVRIRVPEDNNQVIISPKTIYLRQYVLGSGGRDIDAKTSIKDGTISSTRFKVQIADAGVDILNSTDGGIEGKIDETVVTGNSFRVTNSQSMMLNSTLKLYDKTAKKRRHDYGNIMRFIYDFEQSGSGTYINSRPRKVTHLPVQIGGYATVYHDRVDADNTPISPRTPYKPSPIELTPEQNRNQTFMSGKFGYSDVYETGANTDTTINIKFLNDDKDGVVTGIQKDNKTYFQALISNYDAIWTKIGNVVDVRGKLYLYRSWYYMNNGQVVWNSPDASNIPNFIPLSYFSFYQTLYEYGQYIKFPLPVVLKNSDSIKVSTGYNLNSSYPTFMSSNKKYDYNSEVENMLSGYHPSQLTQNPTNICFNGSANIFLYGCGNNTGHNTNIEGNKTVFSLSAETIKASDDYSWRLNNIPDYHSISLDINIDSNINCPITFIDLDDDDYQLINQYKYLSRKKNNFKPISTGKRTASIYIGSSYIKYITFGFSYLLEDDVQTKYVSGSDSGEVISVDSNWPQ